MPQFFPRIPAYQADTAGRLDAIVERNVGFVAWGDHLQIAYFGGQNVVNWTLASDGGEPPRHPNACKNPLAQITLAVPANMSAPTISAPRR